MNAFPILLGSLCVFALGYRYYSAFIAAKVLALDDSRPTPSHVYEDGHNYVPSPKWVLFGHHFAAIAGAGPAGRTDIGRAIRLCSRISLDPDWRSALRLCSRLHGADCFGAS